MANKTKQASKESILRAGEENVTGRNRDSFTLIIWELREPKPSRGFQINHQRIQKGKSALSIQRAVWQREF